MKDMKKVIWGAVLLAAGVIIALNALGVTDIDIWFPGWWTLFIIIPCGVGVFTERDKTGNLIGLGIGVVLLLCAQSILDFSIVWKLALPAVLIILAIKMIIGGVGDKREEKIIINASVNGEIPSGTAIFSGYDMNFDGQIFEGTELTAIFGGVECDLSGAIIEKDCVIRTTAIFGGIDIILPKNVNVKVKSTSVFGGVDDNTTDNVDGAPTVYVTGACVFGGIEVR